MSYGDCVFCRIVAGTEPVDIVRYWDDAIAFTPLNPVTPGHRLVVPRVHIPDATYNPQIAGAVMRRAAELVQVQANIITSIGANATQTVFHLHLHVVPRRVDDGLHLPWTGQMERQPSGAPDA